MMHDPLAQALMELAKVGKTKLFWEEDVLPIQLVLVFHRWI